MAGLVSLVVNMCGVSQGLVRISRTTHSALAEHNGGTSSNACMRPSAPLQAAHPCQQPNAPHLLTINGRLQCSRVHATARAKKATPQHDQCTNAATNARSVRIVWCPEQAIRALDRNHRTPGGQQTDLAQPTTCRRPCSEHHVSTSGSHFGRHPSSIE